MTERVRNRSAKNAYVTYILFIIKLLFLAKLRGVKSSGLNKLSHQNFLRDGEKSEVNKGRPKWLGGPPVAHPCATAQ